MELKQLEFFLAASDCGSLSRAAERLYTTQPNVSKVIAALERELGHRLFERTSRGLRLTEYGRSIQQYAVNILQNASMITHLDWPCGRPQLAVTTYSSHLIAKILTRLHLIYPELVLEHRQGTVEEVTAHVEQGISELGILYISRSQLTPFRHIIAHKRLEFVELARRRACIYVGPNHPYYARQSVTQQELGKLRFVRGLRDYFELEHDFRQENMGGFTGPLQFAAYTNSEHLTGELVRCAQLAVLGISLDDPEETQPGLKHLWIEEEEADLCLGYVSEQGRALSQYSQELVEMLQTALTRDEAVKTALWHNSHPEEP